MGIARNEPVKRAKCPNDSINEQIVNDQIVNSFMFDNLSERLERSFKILKGEGRITEINR